MSGHTKMLNPSQAKRAKSAIRGARGMSTVFTAPGGHCEPQKVKGKVLRGVTYVFPPGSRRTGKPDKYRA